MYVEFSSDREEKLRKCSRKYVLDPKALVPKENK